MSRRTATATDKRPRVMSRGLAYACLVVVLLAFVGPLYWLVTAALKPADEIYSFPPNWIPSAIELENFANVFTTVPFGQFFINSTIVTLAGAAITVVNASLSAYAFTFLRFPLRDAIFYVMLGALMIPGDIALIPNYITVSNLGWLNTYQGIVIPTSASVFGTFLMRQHMRTIPREIIDAAHTDGAGHLRMLMQIVLPMSKPILIATGITALVNEWNQFIWPLIVTNTDNMRTLPVGLLFLNSETGYQSWGTLMAGTLLVALPMLIAFIVAQRHIIEGLTASARGPT